MARAFGRIVVILAVLVAPLWICAVACGLDVVVREAISSFVAPTPPAASHDLGSMAPADCPEKECSAVAEIDNDDVNPPEVLPPAGAPRVRPSDRSVATRLGVRAGAAPPLVHLEVQTPPPRA